MTRKEYVGQERILKKERKKGCNAKNKER